MGEQCCGGGHGGGKYAQYANAQHQGHSHGGPAPEKSAPVNPEAEDMTKQLKSLVVPLICFLVLRFCIDFNEPDNLFQARVFFCVVNTLDLLLLAFLAANIDHKNPTERDEFMSLAKFFLLRIAIVGSLHLFVGLCQPLVMSSIMTGIRWSQSKVISYHVMGFKNAYSKAE
mmetsp:Transcript_22160/g.44015  ORF Transcript_22160/g.44015 Transcript_22160/m.44015 type:complete len:171 (+) Transcript_22160:30-542(+)